MKTLLFYCMFPIFSAALLFAQDKFLPYTVALSLNPIESNRADSSAAVLQKKIELYEFLTHENDQRGASLALELNRGGGCSGELLFVHDSSLMILVQRSIDQKGVQREFIDIQTFRLQAVSKLLARRGSKTGEGTVVGIVAGVALGKILVSGVLARSGEDDSTAGRNLSPRVELMTTLLGGVLGAFVGGMMPDEKIEMVHPQGVDTEKLRSLARYGENAPPQLLHLYKLLDRDYTAKEIDSSFE